jgi:hypothetical protein
LFDGVVDPGALDVPDCLESDEGNEDSGPEPECTAVLLCLTKPWPGAREELLV